MLDEIYVWLESYAGVSYDFNEAITELSRTNACVDPFQWKISIETILDQLDQANDVIDEYKQSIPMELPAAKRMKRILTENMLTGVLGSVRGVFTQLNLDPPTITTVDKLRDVVQTMYELLTMLTSNDINDILKQNMYEDHEENDDDSFANVIGVMKQDVSALAMSVNAIRDSYFDALDADESMDDLQ